MTLLVDFDIKEAVSKLEEFGISTSTHKPCLPDMTLSEGVKLHWLKEQSPSEWCKKMIDEAKDGDEAMAYFELMNIWKEREGEK